jgi:enoyl-CoA hydratase
MIESSQHAGVLTLPLAHGKASTLDVELLDALMHELDGIAEDVRALVLTGTGSIFSAGVDLFRIVGEGRATFSAFCLCCPGVCGRSLPFPAQWSL